MRAAATHPGFGRLDRQPAFDLAYAAVDRTALARPSAPPPPTARSAVA